MKCMIQWIDKNGNKTPDENEAVCMAHYHDSNIVVTNMAHGHVHTTYLETINRSFPICADHLAQVTYDMKYGNGGGWSFTTLESK
jgi:hypothetical protein